MKEELKKLKEEFNKGTRIIASIRKYLIKTSGK